MGRPNSESLSMYSLNGLTLVGGKGIHPITASAAASPSSMSSLCTSATRTPCLHALRPRLLPLSSAPLPHSFIGQSAHASSCLSALFLCGAIFSPSSLSAQHTGPLGLFLSYAPS